MGNTAKHGGMKFAFLRLLLKVGTIGVLLLTASCSPMMIPVSGTGTLQDYTLQYHLDRSAVPQLTYNDLTLKIYVGQAQSVSASVDGRNTPVRYDHASGEVIVTTSGTNLELSINQAEPSDRLGTFSKAVLKDDKLWAWSHSFDDNVNFKQYGIPAFEKYGWRATVYLIGNEIDNTRNEGWIVDKPDIMNLVKKGWGIGNHSWSHQNVDALGGSGAAQNDVARLASYLRQAVDEAGRPDYRLIAFAAPNFDTNYLPVILGMRNSHTTQLMFDESGDGGIMRVDPGINDDVFHTFDPNQAVGRDWRIDTYGSGDSDDQAFRQDLSKMIASLGPNRHYWLNTFAHGVDVSYPNKSIFAFLPWVYNNYGPGGNNSVWVAPADEIYSYMLVRDGVKVSSSLLPGSKKILIVSTYIPLAMH